MYSVPPGWPEPWATGEPLAPADALVAGRDALVAGAEALVAGADALVAGEVAETLALAVALGAAAVAAAALAGVVVVTGAEAAGAVACAAELQAEITRIALAPYTRRRIHRPWDFTMYSSSNDSRPGSPRPQMPADHTQAISLPAHRLRNINLD
jgi:hypothetical protein